MTEQGTIVTVTVNPCIDKSTSIDRVMPEHKLRCAPPKREPGGGGINVARAIHKLGGHCTALWSRGEPTGTLLADLLTAEGIPQQTIPSTTPTRENLIVYEDSTGQQFRFGMPGGVLGEAEMRAWQGAIGNLSPAPAFLVLSGSLPPGAPTDLYGALAGLVPDSTRVVVDTSGESLRKTIESGTAHLIKPNLRELGQLVGHTIESDTEIERSARSLIAAGSVEVVFASLGGGGAILVDKDHSVAVRAPTVAIQSKVGAGDSTVAGLVLALARGWSSDEAARFGVAAGAAAVKTPGTELCKREDAEELYAQLSAS